MGLLNLFKPRYQLAIGDCANRSLSHSHRFPITLSGIGPDGNKHALCRIIQERNAFVLESLNVRQPVYLNGIAIEDETELHIGLSYGLRLKGHLVIICIERGKAELAADFDDERWYIASKAQPEDRESLPLSELNPKSLQNRFPETQEMLAYPMSGSARFRLIDLIDSLPDIDEASPYAPPPRESIPFADFGLDAAASNSSETQHACPCCWKTFSPGDALNIAVHDELIGDPVLGTHAKLRFAAQRFNGLGQALDDHGVVSPDLACPHCRGRLPPSFFNQSQLILSLIGAPSSGKSYYLSVLLRLLPEELIRYFGANLQDGDPSGNAQLNEMKNRLFSATTPEDAFISKTDFEGVMYDRLHRNGKLVSLPRPFVYYLQQFADAEKRASLVFYDNAGEHFKPGVALDDSPGALHVAASTGLLFLFDPTTNRAFRKELRRKRDPQLRSQATDEQDTILSELGVRIKKMRALDSHEKIDTPFALIVGKYDIWKTLIPTGTIQDPGNRPLTPSEISSNSRAIRKLLADLCPTIVANAESISTNVSYFPVSSLGHSPKEIEEGPLAGKLAPNPKRLNPILASAPVLWVLSQSAPDLVQLVDSSAQ